MSFLTPNVNFKMLINVINKAQPTAPNIETSFNPNPFSIVPGPNGKK